MSVLNRQVEAFRAVMLTGGMTAASLILHVTQPAVSRLIRDLEQDLKLELFSRRGNQITPTPEAHALFEEVERRFVALDRLRDYAQELSGARSGSLRIAAMPAMAMGFLPRCIASFVASKPNLSILLDGIPSYLVLERVAGGQFDIGFVEKSAERPSLILKSIQAEMVVVLPQGHLLTARETITAKDLRDERLIMLGKGSSMRHTIEMALGGPPTFALIETPLASIACAMVREGLGLTIVDPFCTANLNGLGVVVRPFAPSLDIGFALVLPRHRPMSKLAQDFVKSLPIRFKNE